MAPANKDLLRRNAFKGHLTKALTSITAALEQVPIDVDHVTGSFSQKKPKPSFLVWLCLIHQKYFRWTTNFFFINSLNGCVTWKHLNFM